MIIFTSTCLIHVSDVIYYSALRIGLYVCYRKKVIALLKKEKKMIGHHTRFRENDDLPLWRAPATKKPQCFNVRVLITGEIVRSKGAQCNTKE